MINQTRFFTKVLSAFLIITTLMSNSSTQVIASSVTEPSQHHLNKDYDASIKEFDEVYKKWKQNNTQAELVENDPLPPALGTSIVDIPSKIDKGKITIIARIANAFHIAVKFTRPDNVVECHQQKSAFSYLEYIVIKEDENLLLNPSNSCQHLVTNVINSDTNNVGKQGFEKRYNVVQQIDEKMSGIIFDDNVNSTINITDLSNDNLSNLALTLFNMDINTFEHQIEQSTAINNYSRYTITLKKDGFKTNKAMVFNVRNDKISSIYSTINETIIQDMK